MEHQHQHSTSATLLDEDLYQSDIVNGAHGEKYQKDLAQLLFERATRKGYDFQLGYEMAIADKFDDVAFLNKKDNKWTLIQTKHADTSKGKVQPLKFDMFFPPDVPTREKGDFSLFKYLKSYMIVHGKIKGPKNVIIFTNRELLKESVDQSVQFEPRQVDEILCFPNNPSQVGLKVTNKLVIEMMNHVNRDFISLRDSIVKLFKEGVMDPVIITFKTPVASILTKTENIVKISENLPSDAYQMLDSLNEIIDIQSAQLPLNKAKDIFKGKSRNKSWPHRANFDIVHQFFQDLTLLNGQPDDLREVIDQDLRLWMRTWIRPNFLLKLEESQLAINTVNLGNFFDGKTTPVKKFNDEKLYKKFFNLTDGEIFFDCIKQDLEKQISNLNHNSNNATEFYINRHIECTVLFDSGCYVNMQMDDDSFVDILFGKFRNQRLLLLTAEPGMGKSTILEYIALAAQQKSRHCVYLFHLNTFEQKLSQMDESDVLDSFLSILRTVLSDKNYRNLRDMFKPNDNTRMHFMIFDALDEISPQNRDKVLDAFKQILAVSNTNIFVSARNNVKTLVENKCGIKTMRLVPFDYQNQTIFFRKFWKVPKENDSNFRKYVTQIFNVFHSDINRALCEFAGLPLMLKMMAEVYRDHFEEYINSKQKSTGNLLPQTAFSIINLYEQFVRKSFANKMEKKFYFYLDYDEENDSLFKTFTLEHQLLAIKVLSIKALQTVFRNKTFADTLGEFERRLKNCTEKSALVEAVDNNITFIHRSYAEFLVTMFLCDNIEKCGPEVFEQDSKESLFHEYPMIRILFFAIIKDRYDRNLFEIVGRHCSKNYQIAFWAYEAYVALGLNTVHFLLDTTNGSAIANRLLYAAAEDNNLKLCTYLFKSHQVKVDCKVDGKTPLHIAAEKDHIDVVRFLIGQSANVNEKDTNDCTALYFASERNNTHVVQLLIENFADINAKNNSGWTPLHLSSLLNNFKVVEMLIANSADIEAKENFDKTPLHLAAKNNRAEIVKLLIANSADIVAREKYGKTPLHLAAENDRAEMVKLLIANSADIEAREKYGKTPLHLATENDRAEMVKLLIANSADIEAKENYGKTSLHLAAKNDRAEIVKLLIANSAVIEAREKYDKTPLHLAAENDRAEIVKWLIANSANIEAKEYSGKTPLHLAAEKDHAEIVKLLIANSAVIEAREKYDKTPLHLAAENDHSEIVKLLITKSADIEAKGSCNETSLHLAARRGHSKVVKLLIKTSASINATNSLRQSALHLAAERGHSEVVKLLIANSADIDAKQFQGKTPLQLATENRHTVVVQILTEHCEIKKRKP